MSDVVNPLALPDRPDPDEIVASAWGDWVHDQLATPHGAAAHRAAVQTVQSAVVTAVNFDVVDRDVAGCRTSQSTYVIRARGMYLVTFSGYFDGYAGPAGNRRHLALRVNNVTTGYPRTEQGPVTGLETMMNLASELPLNAGDILEFIVYQDAGLALNFWQARMAIRLVVPT